MDLMRALFATLPPTGSEFSMEQRARFLIAALAISFVIYSDNFDGQIVIGLTEPEAR